MIDDRHPGERRAVSRKLALYHQSLVDAFSGDAASFFERIMEQAERNVQAARELRKTHVAIAGDYRREVP
jgi:hypothetical protein